MLIPPRLPPLHSRVCCRCCSGEFESARQGARLTGAGSDTLLQAAGTEGSVAALGPILFASRTHSQLAQAVQELKKTAFSPRVCVLGSREQFCIHPEVQAASSNSMKINMCRTKVNNRSCEFHLNVDERETERAAELAVQGHPVMDIEVKFALSSLPAYHICVYLLDQQLNLLELTRKIGLLSMSQDLIKFGSAFRSCPYYLSRRNIKDADIIFLPYNYVINDQVPGSIAVVASTWMHIICIVFVYLMGWRTCNRRHGKRNSYSCKAVSSFSTKPTILSRPAKTLHPLN